MREMREAKRCLSTDPVLLRIMNLLKEAEKSDTALLRHLNMPAGTFDSWKFRNNKSYLTRINDIAEFLNVSPDYLLRGTTEENLDTLSKSEIELIKLYRNTDEKGRCHIMISAEYASKSAENL